MRRLLLLALFFLPSLALAQEVPGETDFNLAINGMLVQSQQLSRAYEVFSKAYVHLKADIETAKRETAYWQDACKSTPECGGKSQ